MGQFTDDQVAQTLEKLNLQGIDLDALAQVLAAKVKVTRPEDEILDFMAEVKRAKVSGAQWLEASQKVIDYYLPTVGLPESGYFIFENVRVCLTGTMEKIQKGQSLTVDQLAHGKNRIKVNNLDS